MEIQHLMTKNADVRFCVCRITQTGETGKTACRGSCHSTPFMGMVAAVSAFFLCGDLVPEQQRNAPHSGKAHQGIDNAADHAAGAAAGKGHQIKPEQTDAAPVQGADDGNDQRNAIQDHHVRNLSFPKGTGSTASIYSHVCGWRTSAADGYTPALTPSVGSPFCPNVCSSNHSVARRNAFYVPTPRDIFPFFAKKSFVS